MRILQIASGDFFSTYGGGQVYVKNIVDQFIKDGIEISILSFYSHSGIKEKIYKTIPLYQVPNNVSGADIKLIFQNCKPDIIHVHSHKDLICEVGKNLNIPVIVTSHHGGIICPAGTLLDHRDRICQGPINHKHCLPCVLRNTITGLRWWYPFMKYLSEKQYIKLGNLLRNKKFIPFITPIGCSALHIQSMKNYWSQVAEKCSLMIAPCDTIANVMTSNGLYSKKLIILPHGIPLPIVKPEFPPINEKIKFYYVGRICYVKGIHVLLKAFNSIENSNIELHLIGASGNKSEKRYMDNLQHRYKSDNRLIWHGKVDPNQIYNVTKDFHISIAPSICMEIYGLNIAESLALGKPVIATRCGGGEMQIEDGKNGWLVEPNNANALREKMEYVINNKELLPAMSENCSAISIQEHCTKLIEIYKSLVSK